MSRKDETKTRLLDNAVASKMSKRGAVVGAGGAEATRWSLTIVLQQLP
jgi:hypothetical protein